MLGHFALTHPVKQPTPDFHWLRMLPGLMEQASNGIAYRTRRWGIAIAMTSPAESAKTTAEDGVDFLVVPHGQEQE